MSIVSDPEGRQPEDSRGKQSPRRAEVSSPRLRSRKTESQEKADGTDRFATLACRLSVYFGVALLVALSAPLPDGSGPGTFIAYSLKEAQRRLSATGAAATGDVKSLGGITEMLGMVLDQDAGDLIVVGQTKRGGPPILLDDLVVAIRSVFKYGKSPLVSIERTDQTEKTGKQRIYWEGGVENTQLGKDMLDADILLKNLALGKISAKVWGVQSYSTLVAEALARGRTSDHVGSRFWFKNLRPSLAIRQGVFAILDLSVGIDTQVLYAEIDGRTVTDLPGLQDEIGDAFASQVTLNLDDLSLQYPVLARARPIIALVSLAEGMRSLQSGVDLSFWIDRYPVRRVDTIPDYDLIEVKEEIAEKKLVLTVSGGFEINPIIIRLNAGDVSALKEAVLASRPSPQKLFWNPPLDGWIVPGADRLGEDPGVAASQRKPAFALDRAIVPKGGPFPGGGAVGGVAGGQPLNATLPTFRFSPNLPSRTTAGIGGVMLESVAQIEGAVARTDVSHGKFSLIVDGGDARLDPAVFSKFVTALWAVYFGDESPGISIDPIDREAEKQLVRYIGNVVNSDLGRVMREADYTMKKWAVGTEKPSLPGFKDVDELMASTGVNYFGASRRFWFVPEAMKFRRSGGLLLFDSGRMTLKTEYMFQGAQLRAEPADREFAKFFTGHYAEIAENYPIYQELFEYAKLTSLAQFLKGGQVPLFWFLMANRDLILTEDSPGTVDQLVRGSKYFRGAEIVGGVDLDFKKGQYVYDQNAVAAVQAVLSRYSPSVSSNTRLSSPTEPRGLSNDLSFDLEDQSYTMVPQHSLSSGTDRRGTRYQTDIAVALKDAVGLQLVRYYDPQQTGDGIFGKGWRLLVPYRIQAKEEERVQYRNVELPAELVLRDLLTGQEETLRFSEDRYALVGYVPEREERSPVIGAFLLSDGTLRLADRLGNEFHFDGSGDLTDVLLGDGFHLGYEYADGFVSNFTTKPYRLEVAEKESVPFLNVLVPKRLAVAGGEEGSREELEFKSKWGIGAYLPEREAGMAKKMVLMTDGSFRLMDRRGNEIAFDPDGSFAGVSVNRQRQRLIDSVVCGRQRVRFQYRFVENGSVAVAKALLFNTQEGGSPVHEVRYDYGPDGSLAGVETAGPSLSMD